MRIVTEVDGVTLAADIGADSPVVKVGRLRECDLVVKNPSVSRRHCSFTFKNGMIELTDLGSSAGCFVNGQRVDTAIVDGSDQIALGNQEVRIEGAAAAPKSRRSRAREPELVVESSGGGGSEFDAFFSSTSGGAVPLPDAAPSADGAMVDPDAPPPGGASAKADDIDFSLPEGRRRSRGGGAGRSRSSGWASRSDGAVVDDAAPSRARVRGQSGSSGGGSSSAASGAGQWELHWSDGGKKWPIDPNGAASSVGRKAGVDFLIVNPTVGRKHATVALEGGRLKVVDLKSSNGTFVNGRKVRDAFVNDGDILGFGSAEVKVVLRGGGGGDGGALPEPIDDWDEWDEGDDDFEMQPPSWHLVWIDGDERVTSIVMDITNRVLAVGTAIDCDISVPGCDGLDGEHIELTWDQGALVVRDLGAASGTQVNGRSVDDEQVLRNHDVVKCGELRLQIIRGTQGQPARTPSTDGYEFWAPTLEKRDDGLSLTFIEYDPNDSERRRELTLWGDGMGSVEKFGPRDRISVDGQATQNILEPLCLALMRAGFPECPTDNASADEEPPELECYFDGESAVVTLTKKTCGKSEHYSEALELLKAILHAWDPVG